VQILALIRREAHLFDAVGAAVARPPADIQSRLRFFYKVNLTLDQINEVLRGPTATHRTSRQTECSSQEVPEPVRE
jgi:hypothetical protein